MGLLRFSAQISAAITLTRSASEGPRWRFGLVSHTPLFRLLVASWGAIAVCVPVYSAEPRAVVETTVGMEGVYYARWRGPALESLPVDDQAAVVLRIADAARDGDWTIYELRYVGMTPGDYDLWQYLRRVDGQPLATQAPMTVSVRAVLPNDHNGELEEFALPPRPAVLPYGMLLVAVMVVWLVPEGWILIRRVRRRKALPKTTTAASTSLADQLHPLVEAAISGELSSGGQARLEFLLLAHWRERLDLTGCAVDQAVARLREHPEAGELLRHLEHWLHEPPGRHAVDVLAVLGPYRGVPSIEPDLGAAAPAGEAPR